MTGIPFRSPLWYLVWAISAISVVPILVLAARVRSAPEWEWTATKRAAREFYSLPWSANP